MNPLIALLSILASTAASAPPVIVQASDFDWSYLPQLREHGYDHLSSNVMERLHEIASQGQCQLTGFAGNRLDFRISFAAQFDSDGKVLRILIPKLNCPEAEGIVGGALLEMTRHGDYRPTGKNPDGWYRGRFTFGFEGKFSPKSRS